MLYISLYAQRLDDISHIVLLQPVYWLTPNTEVARIIKVIVGATFKVGRALGQPIREGSC